LNDDPTRKMTGVSFNPYYKDLAIGLDEKGTVYLVKLFL
jgi:hypothetical protein